jgi:hypothetical protein
MWSTLGMLYFSVQVLKFLGGVSVKGNRSILLTSIRAQHWSQIHERTWQQIRPMSAFGVKRTSSLLLTQSGLLPKSPLERFTPQSLWGGAGGDANSSCFSAAWRLRGHLRGTRSSLGNRLITLLPMRAASLRLLAA